LDTITAVTYKDARNNSALKSYAGLASLYLTGISGKLILKDYLDCAYIAKALSFDGQL
jgi:hypothetical protein